MPTMGNLKTRARRYAKELDSTTSFWTDSFMTQIVNAVYRRRCAQLIMAYEGWFTNVATRDLEADKARYAFPSGFQRLRKLELVRTDGRTVPILRHERHDSINPASTATGDQYLPDWRPLGNGFVLEPTPQQDVTGGLRLEYEGLPVELTSDGDSIHESFPDIYDELLVLDAVIAMFDAESVQQSGRIQSIRSTRSDWEEDFERFIEYRVVQRQEIEPFNPHYPDA